MKRHLFGDVAKVAAYGTLTTFCVAVPFAYGSTNKENATHALPAKIKTPVSAGSKINIGSPVTLGQITVTGEQSAAVETRKKEESAPNIVSIRSAKQIRKLPDVNAAEALSRMPGVTLEEDSGSGRYVHIRGLSADLSSVTFKGIQLPPTNPASPAGGGRAVALDTIPSGLIGSLSVTKTNMPDQDAEALGGTIEITPKSIPASQDYILQGHIGSGDQLWSGTPIYSAGATAGKRFALHTTKGQSKYTRKPFSVVGTVNYHADKRSFPDHESDFQDSNGVPRNAWIDLSQRNYRYHRKMLGFGGELAYDPSDNSHYYIDYFNSGYTETANKNELFLGNLDNHLGIVNPATGAPYPAFAPDPNNPNGILAPAAQYRLYRAHYVTKINTQLVTFGGKNHFKNLSVNYHGAYTQGVFNDPWHDAYSGTFTQSNPATLTYDNTTRPSYPSYSVLSGPVPTDIRGYTLSSLNRTGSLTKTGIWSGAVNFSLPMNLFTQSDAEKLKFGLKTRLENRLNKSTGPTFSSVGDMPLSDAFTHKYISLYDGRYINPGVNLNKIINYYNTHLSQFKVDRAATRQNHAAAYSHDNENVYAGYMQYQAKFGKLGVLAGMRLEATNATYRANSLTTRSDGSVAITANKKTASYFDYFPTFQLRYAFTPKLIGRFVYSSAIGRPGFTQVTASESLNPASGTISRGNPNLKPTTDDAFDLSLSYYLPQGGVVSINPFDKELHNYIVNTTQNGVVLPNSGRYAGFAGPASIQSYKNISSARVYGVELDYQQQFRFLPGPLAGLGAMFNYTYAHSSGEIHAHHSGSLPETSKHTLNAGMFYDKGRFGLNLAMQYRSKDIFGVGSSRRTDVYAQPRLTLNLGSHYQFRHHWQVYFDAKNLLNTPLTFTEGPNSSRIIQREYYGATVMGGVRFNFGGAGSYAGGADRANRS